MAITVYKDAILLKILNTEEELAAFPVEGSFALLFSHPLDELNIKQNVFIIREKPIQDPVSIALNKVKHIGDINVDYYDIVDYSWDTNNATQPIYVFRPAEPLLPNNQYSIVVSQNLAPKFYGIEKVVSSGPSQASLVVENGAISTLGNVTPTTYRIVITQTSQIVNSAHNIKYTLYTNGTPTVTNTDLEVKTGSIALGNGVKVTFNPNVPIILNEEFNVSLIGFSRSGSTQLQKVVTYIDSDVFPIPPEEQTARISQSDLLNFYETNGFARRLGNPVDLIPTDLDSTEVQGNGLFKFRYPNQILIEFDKEIKESSITPDAFKINIGPAFDNGFLTDMGLYSSTDKYLILYKLIEDDFGVSNTIRLTINKDTDNLVPSDTNYILQAE